MTEETHGSTDDPRDAPGAAARQALAARTRVLVASEHMASGRWAPTVSDLGTTRLLSADVDAEVVSADGVSEALA